VHIWGYTSVFPLWYHFRSAPAPVVITLKAVLRPHRLARSKVLGAIQEKASLFLLRHTADAFIVHTTQLFDEACSAGIPQRRLSVIPGCGVAETGMTFIAEEARKAMLLPGKKFVLLAFGVQREDKGILELLEWMREVPDDIHLVIAGEDWTGGKIRDAVDRYGIGKHVSLLLRYFREDEMPALFLAADAVVICHRPGFSGESGVLYHALEGRVPILASLPGHPAGFVREHEIGRTFSFGDPKSFLQAIMRLQNETEAEQRGRVERQALLSSELSWPKISGGYFELYASLLSRHSDQMKA
jgi:glycosyltransferase involved in cell wall biosynthesis